MPEEKRVTKNMFVEKEDERVPDQAELRVSAKGSKNVNKLSSAILAKIREHGYAKVRAIGDPSIGKGFRAAVIAVGKLSQLDMDFVVTGAFFDIELADKSHLQPDDEGIRSGCVINVDPR